MAGVLNRISSARLETFVICANAGAAKLRPTLDQAINLLPLTGGMSQTVETIRAARLDLLYYWEVGVDCWSYFLPFFRLARVQCTSWGWPVSSGIGNMDYFLSSELLEPADGDRHYSETLLRLRNIPNYYPRPTWLAPEPDRTRFAIGTNGPVYLCAQNPRKIQPDFDELAGGILRRDPHGELLMIEAKWPAVTEAIRERFSQRFPDCASRLRILRRMTQADYLTVLATADVVLDTTHYCGGANSTYDAFLVGAPVVTLPGALHRGRHTLAAYRKMEVADCIAPSAEEYVAKAVRLANDRDYRQDVSQRIVAAHDSLFDDTSAVREIEDTFERLIAN